LRAIEATFNELEKLGKFSNKSVGKSGLTNLEDETGKIWENCIEKTKKNLK